MRAACAGGPGALPRGTPEAQAIGSSAIQAFLDAVAERQLELHGFVLVRHGHVAAEGWWMPYGPQFVHSLYSMSKSFTATAVGLAVAEKRLSLDHPVVQFFPDDLPGRVEDNLAAMRVRHLLTMSAGQDSEPSWEMLRQGRGPEGPSRSGAERQDWPPQTNELGPPRLLCH